MKCKQIQKNTKCINTFEKLKKNLTLLKFLQFYMSRIANKYKLKNKWLL